MNVVNNPFVNIHTYVRQSTKALLRGEFKKKKKNEEIMPFMATGFCSQNPFLFVCGNGECWKLDFEFHDRRIEKKKYNG